MSLCDDEKKNGNKCNKPAKFKIRLENEIEYIHPRCGIHSKKINDKDKILLDNINQENKESNKDLSNVINHFNEKIDINENENEVNEVKENQEKNEHNANKDYRKKPCLQYILYLISQNNDDVCQFEDCQFAHNIDIVYT